MKSREERLLRKLRAETAKRGYNVILVRQDMIASVSAFMWERNVERYHSKWATREGNTPLEEWQNFMLNKFPPRAPAAKRTHRRARTERNRHDDRLRR